MKRIFIAVDISDEVRRKVSEYALKLKEDDGYDRLRLVKPENLHITLKFLGDIDDSQLRAVSAIVGHAAVRSPRFRTEIRGAGVFGSGQNQRALWLGVRDPEENLARTARFIDEDCTAVGFPPPKGKLKPHLTIGRLKNPGTFDDLIQIHLLGRFEPVVFDIDHLAVYESKLLPAGPAYRALGRFPLGGS